MLAVLTAAAPYKVFVWKAELGPELGGNFATKVYAGKTNESGFNSGIIHTKCFKIYFLYLEKYEKVYPKMEIAFQNETI
jgi:hypothetical protein